MEEDLNTNVGLETGAEPSGDVAQTDASALDNGQGTSEPTNQSDQTKAGVTDAKLKGDGDWWKADNYAIDGMSEAAKAQFQAKLKEIQSFTDKKINDARSAQKPFSFSNIEELREIAQRPEFQDMVEKMRASEKEAEGALTSPAEYMGWAIDNWNRLSQQQRDGYWNGLTNAEKTTFKTALEVHHQKAAMQQEQFQKLETQNLEKYGEMWKESAPKFQQFLAETIQKQGLREVVFKAMNFERAKDEAYQKGLREARKNFSPGLGLGNNSSTASGKQYKSSLDALDDVLAGVSLEEVLSRPVE